MSVIRSFSISYVGCLAVLQCVCVRALVRVVLEDALFLLVHYFMFSNVCVCVCVCVSSCNMYCTYIFCVLFVYLFLLFCSYFVVLCYLLFFVCTAVGESPIVVVVVVVVVLFVSTASFALVARECC
jgi:hypothetical protein